MDQLLGSRYILHELVGRGAMGQVFRGSVRESGTPVAVKILKPELVSDADIVARFFRERSILLSIAHPNVVRVVDLVVEGQTLGIVMEFVEGGDLRHELFTRHTLPPAEVVRHGRELMDGLAAVHSSGIVHRDVKPENLLVDAAAGRRRLRLTDFGVARLTYGGSLTKLSSLIGTPEYMAPEIADHETATPAADLYSAGIVLYEMLSGRTPFAGGHVMAVLRRHLDEAPPPVPGAPGPLWALIESLLAKDPDARPASAVDMMAALTALEPSLAGAPALPPMPAPAFQPSARRVSPHPGTQVVPGPSADTAQHGPLAAAGAGLPTDPPLAGAVSDPASQPTQAAPPCQPPAASSAGVPVASAPVPPRRSRRGVVAALVLSLAMLLAAASAVVLNSRHPGAPSQATRRWPVVSYAFAPQQYPGSLLTARRWTLGGPRGSRFTETITASSIDGQPHQVAFTEAIPTAIAASVQTVRFTPAAVVIQPDPLVKWTLHLPAQGTVTVGYRAIVPAAGASRARLARWTVVLTGMQRKFHLLVPATMVQSLVITPQSMPMFQNQSLPLTLQGQLVDGSPAPARVLARATWASADPAVASVSGSGYVTAIGAGSTYVTARLTGVIASATIVVATSQAIPPISSASPSPTPVTGSSTPASYGPYKVFHTCNGPYVCGLRIRQGPGTSYPKIGHLDNNALIQIVCQTAGQFQTNTKGVSTDVWDELLQGGFVSDLYVNTQGVRISATQSGFDPSIPRC